MITSVSAKLVEQVGYIILQDTQVQAQIISLALQGLQNLQVIVTFIGSFVMLALKTLLIVAIVAIVAVVTLLIYEVAKWLYNKFKTA